MLNISYLICSKRAHIPILLLLMAEGLDARPVRLATRWLLLNMQFFETGASMTLGK